MAAVPLSQVLETEARIQQLNGIRKQWAQQKAEKQREQQLLRDRQNMLTDNIEKYKQSLAKSYANVSIPSRTL